MSKEKIQFEITFNKDIFAVVYLDHHGYVDPTATQGSTATTADGSPLLGELMVAKGSKTTISEQSMVSLLTCDGSSVMDRDEFVLNSLQIGGLVRACHQPIDRLFELSGSVDGIFLPHHVLHSKLTKVKGTSQVGVDDVVPVFCFHHTHNGVRTNS